jgi:hypothetical protein
MNHRRRRHRQRARVEDRIRDDKDTGLAKFPFKQFALNEVWLEIVLLAHDLIVWTQALLLDGELAKAEPKRLRYLGVDGFVRFGPWPERCASTAIGRILPRMQPSQADSHCHSSSRAALGVRSRLTGSGSSTHRTIRVRCDSSLHRRSSLALRGRTA